MEKISNNYRSLPSEILNLRLSLDALLLLDAIDHKGSFAAAGDELHRIPSAKLTPCKRSKETSRWLCLTAALTARD